MNRPVLSDRREVHRQAIEVVGQVDLAPQAAFLGHVERLVEHVLFVVRLLGQRVVTPYLRHDTRMPSITVFGMVEARSE